MKTLSIVPVEQIPKEVRDCPTDDLLELYKVCQEMYRVCKAHKGVGLAAVQVGVPWRLFLMEHYDSKVRLWRRRYCVNCEYKPAKEEKVKGVEGCLSLINEDGSFRRFEVTRYQEVRVTGFELNDDIDLKLIPLDTTVDGLDAVVFQHEIDHQNGILISDIGQELDIWSK